MREQSNEEVTTDERPWADMPQNTPAAVRQEDSYPMDGGDSAPSWKSTRRKLLSTHIQKAPHFFGSGDYCHTAYLKTCQLYPYAMVAKVS